MKRTRPLGNRRRRTPDRSRTSPPPDPERRDHLAAHRILVAASAILADHRAHSPTAAALDRHGRPVSPTSRAAVRWSITGALLRAGHRYAHAATLAAIRSTQNAARWWYGSPDLTRTDALGSADAHRLVHLAATGHRRGISAATEPPTR